MTTERITALMQRHRLTFAIGLSIVISLVLTATSLVLYNITGTSKLDLSRPGYEVAIKQLKKSENTDTSFSSDNSLDAAGMKKYLKNYQQQMKDLDSYDSFGKKIFEDGQLGLAPDLQTAPPADTEQ